VATAGPNYAGVAANSGSPAWVNPTNAQGADDASFSTVAVVADFGGILTASSFGFAIPAGATITSITYEVYIKTLTATVDMAMESLWGGGEKGIANFTATTTLAWRGFTDAVTLPTVAQANGTDFGAKVYINTADTDTVSIDAFRITITFTPAPLIDMPPARPVSRFLGPIALRRRFRPTNRFDYTTGVTPADMILSAISATSALTNILSTPAPLAPSTIAAQSALTNLLRSPTMLSLSQIAAQSALTNVLSAKVLLVPSSIAAQSDLPNLLVGAPALLTLSEIAAQSALSGSVTSLALLALSTIAAQSAITGAVIVVIYLDEPGAQIAIYPDSWPSRHGKAPWMQPTRYNPQQFKPPRYRRPW